MVIRCRYCHADIEQVATGSWINPGGNVWCNALSVGSITPTLHEPLITPQWRNEIKQMMDSNPRFWTVKRLSGLLQLTEDQIRECLS